MSTNYHNLKITPVQQRVLDKVFPQMLAMLKTVYLKFVSSNSQDSAYDFLERHENQTLCLLNKVLGSGLSETTASEMFADYIKTTDPEFSKILSKLLDKPNNSPGN